MKRFLFSLLFALSVVMNSASATDSDAKTSIIDDSFSEGASTRYRITRIDDDMYFRVKPKDVSSGSHSLDILTCVGTGGNCTPTYSVICVTEAGYIYRVNAKSCFKFARRMDFEGAADYWAKIDAESKLQREAEIDRARKAAAEKEAIQYQSDKVALGNAKTTSDVDRVIESVEWRLKNGVLKDDPENLREQALKKRMVFAKSEDEEKARLEAERKKQDARLAKEEAIRKSAEDKKVDAFRKTLSQGDETNCGLVIERKGKLVKIQLKKTNNEQWVKIQDVFPTTETCSVGQSSSPLQTGQQLCRTLDGITLSQPIPYVVMGAQQYHQNRGVAKVSGFVEGTSGEKIQIRISSITFVNTTEVAQTSFDSTNKGIVSNVQMDSLDGYKGSVLRQGGIIWDDNRGWSTCN